MRGFIEELRYRNVFRVAIAYVVASWVIAQVADLAADAFNAPDWFMQMLIVVLLLGLPIALFLAWAFELTPEGMKRAREVPADAPKDPRSGRILNRVTIIALVIAVAWLGLDRMRGPATDTAAAVDRSIAVLPFDDFSPDSDHAWFADGLTEEILNSLARIADLQVASRTSSFNYRGASIDIPQIAAELGVAHILEGSVRRAGDQLRITAQLIRAGDDKHLWSKNFDGSIENSIAIQEEIAFEIAGALQTVMDPNELARMISAGTRSVAAWEAHLEAKALGYDADSEVDPAKNLAALELANKAVALDPAFAEAHLLIADLWERQIDPTSTLFTIAGPPIDERRAQYSAALDAATKHARSDFIRLQLQMRAADYEMRLADQVEIARRMTELEPERRIGWGWLFYLHTISGDFESARSFGERAGGLQEEYGFSDAWIMELMHRVDLDAAVAMVDRLLAGPSPTLDDIYQSHRILLAAGHVDRAAGLAEDFTRLSNDEEGKTLLQIRQACAEGRVADADALAETVPADSNIQWLVLLTLGHDDRARDLLAPLDTPGGIRTLVEFLGYRSFEARHYPLLWSRLEAQGINRPPARPLAYRCER